MVKLGEQLWEVQQNELWLTAMLMKRALINKGKSYEGQTK